MKLVIRKLTDRCGTLQKLMVTIRELRQHQSGKVTPNEFKYLLCKFGVYLDQNTTNEIFHVIDADRSGTLGNDSLIALLSCM